MKIGIITEEKTAHYKIEGLNESTNDEIARAIMELELIKAELLQAVSFEYEVLEGKE